MGTYLRYDSPLDLAALNLAQSDVLTMEMASCPMSKVVRTSSGNAAMEMGVRGIFSLPFKGHHNGGFGSRSSEDPLEGVPS